MRVTQGMMANNVRFNLQQGLSRMNKLGHQLSTGKSFHRPMENPVGNYKVMRYDSVINYNDRYRTNMKESRGWLESSEIAMMDGLQMLQRIRELTVYSANDPLTDLERKVIAYEIKEYYEAFVGMSNKDFNGLSLFAGHQTLNKAYIEKNIYRQEIDPGMLIDEESLKAQGLRQGSYEVSAWRDDAADAVLTTSQQMLQGSSMSIIGKGEWELVNPTDDFNASISLTIKGIDHDKGIVTYSYESHEYGVDGAYNGKQEGTFNLNFNGDPNANIAIGSLNVNVNGLDVYADKDIADIKVGDKAILNLQAAHGNNAEAIKIGADFREGHTVVDGEARNISAAMTFYFEGDTFSNINPGDDKTASLKFHTLNLFTRSGDYGKVYEGTVSAQFADIQAPDGDGNVSNLSFFYDPEGFAVYQGDNGQRRQEVAPNQKITMNLDGNRVFGNEETDSDLFGTIKNLYWALMDNDRDELGGVALQEMDNVIENLLLRTTEVGARLNRVETMDSMLFEENIFLREMRSDIEDIDMAQVLTEYMMQENVYQAALATTARMMQPTLIDFMR